VAPLLLTAGYTCINRCGCCLLSSSSASPPVC